MFYVSVLVIWLSFCKSMSLFCMNVEATVTEPCSSLNTYLLHYKVMKGNREWPKKKSCPYRTYFFLTKTSWILFHLLKEKKPISSWEKKMVKPKLWRFIAAPAPIPLGIHDLHFFIQITANGIKMKVLGQV